MPTAQRGKYANLVDCRQNGCFQEQPLAVLTPLKRAMSQILFLHGFGQTEPDSTPQLKALRTALPHSSVLAPTYHPGGSVEATRVSVALAGLSELLKSASRRTTHLVGYSFGGLLSALLAERHPELVDRVLLSPRRSITTHVTMLTRIRLTGRCPLILRWIYQRTRTAPLSSAQPLWCMVSWITIRAAPRRGESRNGPSRSALQLCTC